MNRLGMDRNGMDGKLFILCFFFAWLVVMIPGLVMDG